MKSLVISFLFFLMITVSFWTIFKSSQIKTIPTNVTSSDSVDAIMENINATVFNKEGKLTMKVATPKMVHYLKSNIIEITTPKIILQRTADNVWYVDSNSAQAIESLNKIIFHDNVIIRHQEDVKHPMTTLYTSSLTVYPDKQIAETKEAISMIQPTAKVTGIGMLANMKDQTVKLLSQAKEEYAPNSY